MQQNRHVSLTGSQPQQATMRSSEKGYLLLIFQSLPIKFNTKRVMGPILAGSYGIENLHHFLSRFCFTAVLQDPAPVLHRTS
ncbi:hypothetical protein EUGRSUZ_B00854 [Eucalyptus grandis]|uniref:Uncharacterized protein n=2 Tax=Eucalyptus grandis TaxID=71139 RepID=A0ACC3LNS6_EUCGR|nr:hypothetical protein EUGRSUZ_B00854 [Eucalyptus grandis]